MSADAAEMVRRLGNFALAEQMRSAVGGRRGLFEVPFRRSLATTGQLSWRSNPTVILRIVMVQEQLAGCSKRPSSAAAASEEARRTLRYVEPLSDARTKLADFFSILLERNEFHSRADERLSTVEPKRLSRAEAVTLLEDQKGRWLRMIGGGENPYPGLPRPPCICFDNDERRRADYG